MTPQTKELDQPSEWPSPNDSSKTVSVDDDAKVSCRWHVSFFFANGYGQRAAFSPVIDVTLQQPVELPTSRRI